jgi:hypothetical protein
MFQVVCVLGLFDLKRWGLNCIALVAIVATVINLFVAVNLIAVYGSLFFNLGLLIVALKFGGDRNGWDRLT